MNKSKSTIRIRLPMLNRLF